MSLYVIAVFAIYGAINIMLEIFKKKIHAKSINIFNKRIKGFYICGIISPCIILLCSITIKHTSGTLPTWQAILLGCILIAFSCLSISKVFYMNPEHKQTRQSLKEKLNSMTKQKAIEFLQEHLPDKEYQAIYYCDYEKMTIEDVAFFKLNCSEKTVRTHRYNAYNKLNKLFKD